MIAVLTLCSAARSDPSTQPGTGSIAVTTIGGQAIRPLVFSPSQKAVVLLFVATDCPISNAYAPTIAATVKAFADKGIRFYLVYSDPDMKAADVAHHQTDYALPDTAVLDPRQQLAQAVHATVTPQAVVVGADLSILYDGTIDDMYASVGHKRFAATRHYLSDALTQILDGKKVAVARTQPFGCGI